MNNTLGLIFTEWKIKFANNKTIKKNSGRRRENIRRRSNTYNYNNSADVLPNKQATLFKMHPTT